MRTHVPLAVASVILVLAGFGCAGKPEAATSETTAGVNVPTAAPSPTPAPDDLPPTAPTESAPADDLGAAPLTTTVALDDTWKTYTNAALGFEFRWPSKGRYAPDWEVRFITESDARMKDGCFTEGANERNADARVSVSDVRFCHTAYNEGAAGSRYLTDHYATLKGKTVILISFTKKTSNAGVLGCTGFELSASPTTCVEFDQKAYLDLLSQSVSTFRYR